MFKFLFSKEQNVSLTVFFTIISLLSFNSQVFASKILIFSSLKYVRNRPDTLSPKNESLFRVAASEWNYDSLGNHRAVLEVISNGKVAKAKIVWRRRDFQPEQKLVFVVDAKTNQRILNVQTENISRSSGTILFEPKSGKGTYYVYYMPYQQKSRSVFYPKSVYHSDTVTASAAWLNSVKQFKNRVIAKVKAIEAVNKFNDFNPMELIASPEETAQLIKAHRSEAYLIFPEDRMHSIRMTNDLPYRWIQNGVKSSFYDRADKAENFAFQLGVFAFKNPLSNVKIQITDLKSKDNQVISKSVCSVLNNEGVNWLGQAEKFQVNILKGKVQAFWLLINVPEQTAAGLYTGKAIIQVAGEKDRALPIALQITDKTAVNHGVNEPWKQTRLTWLNSTMAEKDALMPPYTPLQIHGNEISLLGRKIVLESNGFPKSIQSFFTEEMTEIGKAAKNILASGIAFHVLTSGGKEIALQPSGLQIKDTSASIIHWTANNTSKSIAMQVDGLAEFDGFMNYEVKIIAKEDIDLKDISMHLPLELTTAKYLMGLGEKGEKRPESFSWKWNVSKKNQDGAWIGDVNAGIQFGLRDEKYSRPLNTNFYLKKPLILPASWGNGDKGGIQISTESKSVLVNCFSGARNMKAGDTLYYNFRLLITPFHEIQTDFQWANRFVHKDLPTNVAKSVGATVINIHQGTTINPYINYPFIKTKEMKAYIDSAHTLGMKVKIYNTVRELSNRAYELPALFSLGNEIYSKGQGGGYSWLQEHLDPNYIPAWYTPEAHDAAIINSGMSRWHNYYVEGMNWLTQQLGIDGIYLDDVAFDRDIMKRIKKVMTDGGHPGIIDLHSANQFNPADGFNNSANLYLELFPYLNRLWFGENFDYENNSPDFYLTEMSGIPFGLMGEMLQNNGNPYRGMLYGMTNRLYWNGGEKEPADPRPIWKVWNDFGMEHSKMIGYWVKSNPVKTNQPEVLATIYQKNDAILIALASWAKDSQKVTLLIDWKKLGWKAENFTLEIPEVAGLQKAASIQNTDSFEIAPAKGKFIILKRK